MLRVPYTGSQRGGPWSPGALKFLLWSPEPYHFTDWSPDPFLDVEPGAQRHFARSPEPSIFKFDHSSSQIALILVLLPFCVCLCVLTGIKKQNLEREQNIIQVNAVISVYNDMQQLIKGFNENFVIIVARERDKNNFIVK